MKNLKKLITALLFPVILIAMITMSKEITTAANAGIALCVQVVIPSLFPFFVICTYLNGAIAQNELMLLRPLGRFCRIPKGSESIFLIGLLGGYPIGAQCVSQSHEMNILSKSDAERMLGFCNNAGPAFIFGMLSIYFPKKYMLWLLWLVQIVSSILTAHLIPGLSDSTINPNLEYKKISLPSAVRQSVQAMATVCGWVILFRIIIHVTFGNLKAVSKWALLLLTGVMELTNGCTMLTTVDRTGLRFVLSSALLSFGGICVHMQTFSVTNNLQKHIYLIGKMLQTIISIVISTILQQWFFPTEARINPSIVLLCYILIFLITTILLFFRKSSRFSARCVIQYRKTR